MPAVSSPSSVVVSDRTSLAQNFSENAKSVLCQAAFGAGVYAIGSRLVGAPLLPIPARVVTAGALVAALALCPSGASQEGLFGAPGEFVGGQCPVSYSFECVVTGNDGLTENASGFFIGPVATFEPPRGPSGAVSVTARDAAGNPLGASSQGFGLARAPYTLSDIRVKRTDLLPDNCGSPPGTPGQVIVNNNDGDTLNTSNVVNNTANTYVAPITINAGGVTGVINMPFSNIKVGSLLPLKFSVNIGGSRFGFKENPDGVLEPEPTNPDEDQEDDSDSILRQLRDRLKEIKDCVCKPDVELSMLMLPVVGDISSCSVDTSTFLVPKGSVSDAQFEAFVTSSELAKQACEDKKIKQLPENAIFSASTTKDGREIFTGEISPEVVSLRLSITEIREDGPRKIDLYPASNQRKFGSVSYVSSTVNGGGDYIYIYDTETYIPLPRRAKPGKLRLLLKRGLSFSVYDTGERLRA